MAFCHCLTVWAISCFSVIKIYHIWFVGCGNLCKYWFSTGRSWLCLWWVTRCLFVCLSGVYFKFHSQCSLNIIMPHNHDGLEWLRQCRSLSNFFFPVLLFRVSIISRIENKSHTHFFFVLPSTLSNYFTIISFSASFPAAKSISKFDVNFFLIAVWHYAVAHL
jgi:hypothetical protein